jgi:hypothetical protein
MRTPIAACDCSDGVDGYQLCLIVILRFTSNKCRKNFYRDQGDERDKEKKKGDR